MIKNVLFSSTSPVSTFTFSRDYGECDAVQIIFKTPNGCGSKIIRGNDRNPDNNPSHGPLTPPDIISYEVNGNVIVYELGSGGVYTSSSASVSIYGIIRLVKITMK